MDESLIPQHYGNIGSEPIFLYLPEPPQIALPVIKPRWCIEIRANMYFLYKILYNVISLLYDTVRGKIR